MPIVSDKLGTNPLHRMRNRIAAEILEESWKVNYNLNKEYFNSPRRVTLESLPSDRLALIVGAGPSLKKNLADLKQYGLSWKPTVFCTDKAVEQILPYTIPEYVCALNAQSPKGEVEKWWKKAPTEHSTLIMPITADPVHLKHWDGKFCFVNCALPIDLTDRIAQETKMDPIPGGSNVGVFSYLMATRMGFKTIFLIGMDYSFASRKQVVSRYGRDEPYIVMEHRNTKGEVRWSTWDWFDSAIAFFEYARFFGRNGIRTINCTDGGIIYDGEYVESMTVQEAGNADWL